MNAVSWKALAEASANEPPEGATPFETLMQ